MTGKAKLRLRTQIGMIAEGVTIKITLLMLAIQRHIGRWTVKHLLEDMADTKRR